MPKRIPWGLCLLLLAAAARADDLPNGAVRSYGHVPFRHAAQITHVAASADGKFAATLTVDGQLHSWDLEAGKLIAKVAFRRNSVGRILFARDGKRLLVMDHQQGLSVLSTDKLEVLKQHGGQGRINIMQVALHPDGKQVAVIRYGGKFQVECIDIDSGATSRSLTFGNNMPTSLAFRADGALVTFTQDGTITTTTPDGKQSTRRITPLMGAFHAAMLAESGDRIATFEHTRRLAVWKTDGGETPIFTMEKEANQLFLRQISPDCRLLLLNDQMGQLRIWDVEQRAEASVPGTTLGVPHMMVSFSGDGRRLLGGAGTECLRVIDTKTWESAVPIRGHTLAIRKLACTSDAKYLVSGSGDASVRIWDRATGKQLRSIEGLCAGPSPFGMDAQGQTLAVIRRDRELRVSSVAGGDEKTYKLPAEKSNIKTYPLASCDVSPDGKFAAVFSGSMLDIFDLERAQPRPRIELAGRGSPARLWLGNRTVACQTGQSLATFALDAPQTAPANASPARIDPLSSATVSGSPDSNAAALTQGWDFAFTLDNAADAKLVELFSGLEMLRFSSKPGRRSTAVAVSPSGHLFATAALDDKSIRLWDSRTGQCVHAFEPAPATVTALAFSCDGRTIFSGASQGAIHEWPLPAQVAAAAQVADGNLADDVRALALAKPSEAYAAIERLVAGGERALPLMRPAVLPPRLNVDEFTQLLNDLDADDFTTRERAASELALLGPLAVNSLERALAHTRSNEVASRIPTILSRIRKNERTAPVIVGRLRAIHVIERINTPAARALLQEASTDDQPAPVLKRAKLAIERMDKK